MAIPDYQTLMLPLLKRAALGEMRVLEAERQMGEEFGLTPEEREQLLPSGKQRVLHNRAHWAKFYLMKAASSHSRAVELSSRLTLAGHCLRGIQAASISMFYDSIRPLKNFIEAVTPAIPKKCPTRGGRSLRRLRWFHQRQRSK